MTSTPADLDELAVSVRKSLHWCVFLLGAMILILVIDVQIKRSIGRQAVSLAAVMNRAATDRLTADVKGAGSGRQPVGAPGHDADHPGGDGSSDVDGIPGVATGDDQAGGPVPAKAPRRRSGTAQRAPRDGG